MKHCVYPDQSEDPNFSFSEEYHISLLKQLMKIQNQLVYIRNNLSPRIEVVQTLNLVKSILNGNNIPVRLLRKIENDVQDKVFSILNNENDENIWKYLFLSNEKFENILILRKQSTRPSPDNVTSEVGGEEKKARNLEIGDYNSEQCNGGSDISGKYLIGRRSECDLIVDDPKDSDRHAVIFTENNKNTTIAVLDDLSSNGTSVNHLSVGSNKARELEDYDEIAFTDSARFVFRYHNSQENLGFQDQYTLEEKLRNGSYGEVCKCIDKKTGQCYAAKRIKEKNTMKSLS
ncbi:hypothetical protein K3495_g7953 [Podosphaera aphanis]|nr:hypothetical protein K3495_g7953 [Podosphaera aphanis]